MPRQTTRKAAHPPAGAAVLQPEVTEAINVAVLEELAAVGYGRLSIEGVARRAGVSKTALYRRWPTKQPMVVALFESIALHAAAMTDTGSLAGDVELFLREAMAILRDPLMAAILPDLLAEGARSSAFAGEMLATIRDPRRARAAELVHRAIRRKELPRSLDVETAIDCLAGPLYWRVSVVRTPVGDDYLARLSRVVIAAMRAATKP